jgi:hypothetical protein
MVLLQSVVVTGLYKEANMDQENKNNEQEIIRTTTVSEPEVVRATTTVNEPARTSITYDEAAKTTTTVKQSVWSSNAVRIVYYLLGVLEALLGIRLILKLLGANPKSAFVTFIYNVTGIFLAPFEGIFRNAISSGIETKSVLEPGTIIAMLIYALIAWGIVKLIRIIKNRKPS